MFSAITNASMYTHVHTLLADLWTVLHYLWSIFHQNWKVLSLWIWFVCLLVHALILVNILQIPWNLYRFFKSAISCFTLKMVYVGQMFRIQRGTKEYRNIMACKWKYLKCVLTYLYYTNYNEINMLRSDVHTHCFIF